MQVSIVSVDHTLFAENYLTASETVFHIGPPIDAHEIIQRKYKDRLKKILIAINVSHLEVRNIWKIEKIDWIASLTMLTKLVLVKNKVTNFPPMKRLLFLKSVELSEMRRLKSVGKELGSAPALCSLEVECCRSFKSITKEFIVGVTSTSDKHPAGASLRFHTLRVERCPLVMTDLIGDLAGLRILSWTDLGEWEKTRPRQVWKIEKIDWIANITMLTKLVLWNNDVTNFPLMNKLLFLESVELRNIDRLESVGKELGSAPALCSLEVGSCKNFKSITKEFIVGVTSTCDKHPTGASLRFHTLRLAGCPFVMTALMGDLAGLRILSLTNICQLEIKFPALGGFVHLEELTVEYNNYRNFAPVEELSCLTFLKRLVLNHIYIKSVEGICALTALEYLRLSHIYISRLPDEVGQMTHLRTLEIIMCDRLEDLPSAIATLPLLESFSVSRSEADFLEGMGPWIVYPDTFMFRRVSRMLPFMKSLKSLKVSGVEDENGVLLAHVLQTWPPPLLETLHFFPHLHSFILPDQYSFFKDVWDSMPVVEIWESEGLETYDCMAVVEIWQGQVSKAEAFVCGTHAVMGRESFVSLLNKDVLKIIVSHVLGRVPQRFSIHDLVDDQQIGSS